MKIMQRGFSAIVIVLGVLLVLGIGAGGYFMGKNQISNSLPSSSAVSQVISPYATITNPPTPTEDPNNPNSKVFTSFDLGISFNYTSKNGGISGSLIGVKQVGNKVYVYSTANGRPEDGQYVEVFFKEKNDSLIEAIKKKILTGYSLNDCLVKTTTTPFTGQTYPVSFELAEIVLPYSPDGDMEKTAKNADKCPATYISFGGINYFLSDPAHPDKFLHFSIGQYGIDSGIGDKLWQTTIKFLP